LNDAPRQPAFALARLEKRALVWIAERLPRWVMPDHLTALGILAAIGIGAGYLLTNETPLWLWAVNALLILHWLGDSLDGTLARVRKIERPRYGYYLDHLTDAISTVLIGLGLGLSPYMLLVVGLAIVIAYLVLSINTYLETSVFEVFKLGYLSVGPTEARLALFAVNTLIALGVGVGFTVADVGLTVIDLVGIAAVALMTIAFAGRAVHNLRELAKDEPSARWRARMAA
jgi:phosphatidylglycerophosphate synthase